MIQLALTCALIAAFCTIALFQIFRGIKTKTPKKTIIGVVLLILALILLYFLFVLLMINMG